MRIGLSNTTSAEIAAELVRARRRAGSPAMGMVLTLIVVTGESEADAALDAASTAAKEHPARILGVILGSKRGVSQVDAEIEIATGSGGEAVLMRLQGEVAKHSESVVLPLLLPDSPVVVWWPGKAPDCPSRDPLGALAQRRITDAAAAPRGKSAAMWTQCRYYEAGNTDLAWTRLTGWRALLAAALDQHPSRVTGAEVTAQRISPSAELLVAWLAGRLKVDVRRKVSRGPGITRVRLWTKDGEIRIDRPDGRVAMFSTPGSPDRPVALRRREVPELLAEELRRLDPDEVYARTAAALLKVEAEPGRAAS
ncbi:MAG: oxidoreductase [Propionibacteriales bacterium]|nr:oxidoreductase [Propionibacteriales bacterium]